MTLVRIALHLAQECDPDWWAWAQTWQPRPEPNAVIQSTVSDDHIQHSWINDGAPVSVSWKDRELLDTIKNKTAVSVAGPLLWRMARMASDHGELDELIRQVVAKETGASLEFVPFVRKGQELAARMDAEVASKAKKQSKLVTILVDRHGTLIKVPLTDSRVCALLDRFLRRHLWTT